MATTTGKIRLNATDLGAKTLIVYWTNPSPPPAELTKEFNGVAWLWDLVKGNAGSPIVVTHDNADPPVVSAATVG